MPVKLKDLAQQLGLSQTTVSRALNGYPEVSEATRERVLRAARRLHYQPNARAQRLATGRAMAIGHVIPTATKYALVNPIFADFMAGAGETYAGAGYDLLMSVVREEDELDAYRQMAARGSVDGVIVHGPRAEDPRIAVLKSLGLPFVVHGRLDGPDQSYAWLDINNGRSFRRAADLLFDLGHRRVALLNGPEVMDFAARRRAGYLEAHRARAIPADPALMLADEMTEGFGFRSGLELLRSEAPPTAFLVSSYIIALGVRRAAETLGLSLGTDISLITHDDDLSYLNNRGDVPAFSATRSSAREAGRRCAEIVIERIAEPDAPPLQELWETELTIGLSTGPCRSADAT